MAVFALAAAALMVLSLAAGCVQDPEETVVSMDGWSATMDHVRSEYELIHGDGSFDSASLETREAFVRTLADKEILLDTAIRSEQELRGRFARKVRIAEEKNLIQDFMTDRRTRFSLTEKQIAERLPLISRAALIRFAQLRDPRDSDGVLAAQQDGADFETLARKHGVDLQASSPNPASRDAYWMEVLLRIDTLHHPMEFVVETLMKDLPVGAVAPPVKTPDAVFLLQLLEYRPVEEAESEAFRQRALQVLEHIGYVDDLREWTEAVKAGYGLQAHTETYPLIISRIAGFRDSIRDAAAQDLFVDYAALAPPVWRFTPEELQQPAYYLGGETYTVLDFMESLRSVDLDLWAALPEPEKAAEQIDNRLIRFPILLEARKAGFDGREEYRTGIRRTTEEAWLDQYFDSIGREVQPTEDDIQAAYDRRAETKDASELLTISVLTYPESLRSRGEEMLERLQEADSLQWFDLAQKESAADQGIEFLPQSEPAAVARMEQHDPMLPLYREVVSLPAGGTSGLFSSAPDACSIIRVLSRSPHPVRVAYDSREVIERRVHRELREARVEEVLEEGRTSRGVRVNLDLLAR